MTTAEVDTVAGLLTMPSGQVPCRIGRGGACPAEAKREGDGCTPLGTWPIRGALFRLDRFAPPARLLLPWRGIGRQDGWSDDPLDPDYNRPVTHPHAFSAERLWREDGAYDAVLVLGFNDRPSRRGAGSAIFLHLVGSGATEGCVAVDRAAMHALLGVLSAESVVRIF